MAGRSRTQGLLVCPYGSSWRAMAEETPLVRVGSSVQFTPAAPAPGSECRKGAGLKKPRTASVRHVIRRSSSQSTTGLVGRIQALRLTAAKLPVEANFSLLLGRRLPFSTFSSTPKSAAGSSGPRRTRRRVSPWLRSASSGIQNRPDWCPDAPWLSSSAPGQVSKRAAATCGSEPQPRDRRLPRGSEQRDQNGDALPVGRKGGAMAPGQRLPLDAEKACFLVEETLASAPCTAD